MEKKGYLITREMVYGTETPEIPDGWEVTGEFRPPKDCERFVLSSGGDDECIGNGWANTEPRIILRKKRTRKIVFTQVSENRMPKKGEWFMGPLGWVEEAQYDFSANPYPIFTREEVFE